MGETITRHFTGITCYGAYVLNQLNGKIETFTSRAVVLSTGGIGQIYQSTTNPALATGDGIAMAYRAKAKVADMEFVQFHPTAFYNPKPSDTQAFLISEAVRGEGAELKTPAGDLFMHRYDARGSLAPRDIVARAIDAEMKRLGADYMCLDCREIDTAQLHDHFPTIEAHCLKHNINPAKQMIPVVPSAHYVCGGIAVDEHSQSSIQRLYAVGECSRTGLHGANRLASNSLLECLVYAHQASEHLCEQIDRFNTPPNIPDWNAQGTTAPKERVLLSAARKELQSVMSQYMGIVRSNTRQERVKQRLYQLYEETESLYRSTTISPQLAEIRNMITIGYLIHRAASDRTQNKGLHYNIDNSTN